MPVYACVSALPCLHVLPLALLFFLYHTATGDVDLSMFRSCFAYYLPNEVFSLHGIMAKALRSVLAWCFVFPQPPLLGFV
jgi:hypothetical protein